MLCLRSRSIAPLFKPFPDISPPFFFILPRRSKYNVERLAKPPKLPEDYEERNENLKRALSPHITIYKLEMPAHQSLAHRTTGIMLSTYLVIFGLGALVLPNDFAYYVNMVYGWDLNCYLLAFLKFMIAWPFTIHFVGGVKHLIWDAAPICLKKMDSIYIAGYAVFALGTISAIWLASIKTGVPL